MSRPRLTPEQREQNRQATELNTRESYKSLGWVSRNHALFEDEHCPEYPNPQGPNLKTLVRQAKRERPNVCDEFDPEYGVALAGRRRYLPLKFD